MLALLRRWALVSVSQLAWVSESNREWESGLGWKSLLECESVSELPLALVLLSAWRSRWAWELAPVLVLALPM